MARTLGVAIARTLGVVMARTLGVVMARTGGGNGPWITLFSPAGLPSKSHRIVMR